MRQTLSAILRRTPVGNWLLDDIPLRVRDALGRSLWVPRRIARLARAFDLAGVESQLSLRHYAGGHVLDVGGNWGAYALLLAPKARVGAVFASFEPSEVSFRILVGNLAALGGIYSNARFLPLPFAVGNGTPAVFSYPMGTSYHPSVRSDAQGDPAHPTTRLDDFVAISGLRPEFVKIDVEGAELFVLEGMPQILERNRPVVMLEVHPEFQPHPDALEQIGQLLVSAKYRKSEVLDSGVTRSEYWLPS